MGQAIKWLEKSGVDSLDPHPRIIGYIYVKDGCTLGVTVYVTLHDDLSG